jgi:hypothetical protein
MPSVWQKTSPYIRANTVRPKITVVYFLKCVPNALRNRTLYNYYIMLSGNIYVIVRFLIKFVEKWTEETFNLRM